MTEIPPRPEKNDVTPPARAGVGSAPAAGSEARPYLCYCFVMTEAQVRGIIEKCNVRNVDDVTRLIRAGGGCRTCRPDIQALIDAHAASQSGPAPGEGD